MKNKVWLSSVVVVFTCMFSLEAFSHARLFVPAPRNDDTGDTTGPCGGIAAATPQVTYTAGQLVTVNFAAVIEHSGPFTLSFSAANDQNFVLLGTYPERQNVTTFPDTYNETITIPNTPCTQCTLQLMQTNSQGQDSYYSCADIAVVAAAGTPTPSPSPSMSPAPTPTMSGGASGPFGSQGVGTSPPTSDNGGAKMASCGSVHDASSGGGRGAGNALMIFLPLLMIFILRRNQRALRSGLVQLADDKNFRSR